MTSGSPWIGHPASGGANDSIGEERLYLGRKKNFKNENQSSEFSPDTFESFPLGSDANGMARKLFEKRSTP